MTRRARDSALWQELLARGLAASEREARARIMAGDVIVNDHRIDKPGTRVSSDAVIRLRGSGSSFASRGGEKLARALQAFDIAVEGLIALDVGASTGGFTDCLLQKGVAHVHAVDVGYGQLAWKLRSDPRVSVHDRTNIRTVRPDTLEPPPQLAVVDASFTALAGLLAHVAGLLPPQGSIIALVKPQFEVAPQEVETGGLVRDERRYRDILRRLFNTTRDANMLVAGVIESPIRGHKGNREFLLYLRLTLAGTPPVPA